MRAHCMRAKSQYKIHCTDFKTLHNLTLPFPLNIIFHDFQKKTKPVIQYSLFAEYTLVIPTVMHLFMVCISHGMVSLFPFTNLNLTYVLHSAQALPHL